MAASTLLHWFAFTVASSSLVDLQTAPCNRTFYDCSLPGGCFFGEMMDKLPQSMESAAAECALRREHGKLPRLDTQNANVRLARALHAHMACALRRGPGFFWLGLQREKPQTQEDITTGWKNLTKWRWLGSDETMASFAGIKPWKHGEPNNADGSLQDAERCVIAEWQYDGYSKWLWWSDSRCNGSWVDLYVLTATRILVCQVRLDAAPTSKASSTQQPAATTTTSTRKNGAATSIVPIEETDGSETGTPEPRYTTPRSQWPWQWWLLGTCALLAVLALAAMLIICVITRRRRRKEQREQRKQRSDIDDAGSRGRQRSKIRSPRTHSPGSFLGDPLLDGDSKREEGRRSPG